MDWLRWWHGTVTDPKFRLVARKAKCNVSEVIAVWAVLLERASMAAEVTEKFEPVTRGDIKGFDGEACDALLDLDEGVSARILDALEEKGLVSDGRITNWDKRQVKRERERDPQPSGSSTERVARYRAKKKAEACNAVTTQQQPSNANVTPQNGVTSQKQPSNAIEKRIGEERILKENCIVPSDAGDPAPAADKLICPAQQIVDAYHELMPDNPRVKVLSPARRGVIAARWREASRLTCKPFGYSTTADGLDCWKEFFSVCADSDFLTGKAPAQQGRPPFVADIDFLMSPKGFAGCLESKYHRGQA